MELVEQFCKVNSEEEEEEEGKRKRKRKKKVVPFQMYS